jgi:hypothetical protein
MIIMIIKDAASTAEVINGWKLKYEGLTGKNVLVLVFGFIEHLQNVSKDSALTVLHTLQFTKAHNGVLSYVFTAVLNGGRSPSSGFPDYPRISATSTLN